MRTLLMRGARGEALPKAPTSGGCGRGPESGVTPALLESGWRRRRTFARNRFRAISCHRGKFPVKEGRKNPRLAWATASKPSLRGYGNIHDPQI